MTEGGRPVGRPNGRPDDLKRTTRRPETYKMRRAASVVVRPAKGQTSGEVSDRIRYSIVTPARDQTSVSLIVITLRR